MPVARWMLTMDFAFTPATCVTRPTANNNNSINSSKNLSSSSNSSRSRNPIN